MPRKSSTKQPDRHHRIAEPIRRARESEGIASGYRDLIEMSDLGIHIGALNKGRVFANQSCASLFGFDTPDEFFGVARGHIIAEADRERVLEINDRLYKGKINSSIYEFDAVRKDGSKIPVQAFAQRVMWEGEPAIQRTFIDLTDRKRAEKELRASETRLARAQRIGNMGSWEWDVVTNEMVWSDQTYRIFGLEPQEFDSSYPAFLERVHPDDRRLVEKAGTRAIEARAPYDIMHRIVTSNGGVRIVHEQGEIECCPAGQILKMTGTVQDVTERKEAESELLENRAMLSGILTIAEEAIILADNELKIILFSRGAESVFGFAAAEAIGLGIDQLIPPRFRAVHNEHVRGFSTGTETSIRMGMRAEVTGLRKNGEEFPAAVSLSKLPTAQGFLYSVILRDIGPENAARDELLAAKLTAESGNEAKSNFLANMSHELRTPLNAIIGCSDVMRQQTFGPVGDTKYIGFVNDIHQAGQQLLKIINDILDLSKIESGNIDLHEAPLNIPEIIGICIALMKDRARDKCVSLGIEVTDDLPSLFADERMLKQILINLLSNAIKFTLSEGRVTIRAWCQPNSGHVLQISDTGIGIAADDIPTALTPFKQVDSSLNRRYEGIGLGLPLSKFLAERHGGILDLQSQPNEGTTVTVRFPANRIHPGAA